MHFQSVGKDIEDKVKKLARELEQSNQDNIKTISTDKKNVFIVHGHEKLHIHELKDILKDVGVSCLIGIEDNKLGKTIIEAIEENINKCEYGIVLLTPDDVGCSKKDFESEGFDKSKKCRARQNVILEMGYLMGKLGRDKVMILYKKEGVELPSDINGMLYVSYKEDVKEAGMDIIKELKKSGIIKQLS